MKLRFVMLASVLMGVVCAQSPTQPPHLTALSYNVHYAIGMDGKTDLARIARVIRDSKAGVVGLQEIGSKAMAKEALEADDTAKLRASFWSNRLPPAGVRDGIEDDPDGAPNDEAEPTWQCKLLVEEGGECGLKFYTKRALATHQRFAYGGTTR